MWIVILNFFIFLLLASIFVYGLHYWQRLISEPEEVESEPKDEQIETFYYRAPLWFLLAGITIHAVLKQVFVLF